MSKEGSPITAEQFVQTKRRERTPFVIPIRDPKEPGNPFKNPLGPGRRTLDPSQPNNPEDPIWIGDPEEKPEFEPEPEFEPA